MAINYNKIILGGRICNDVTLKTTPSGITVANFNLAVGRGKDITDFFSCVAWRGAAETISTYFRKGSQIIVTGKLTTRAWKDQQGNNRMAYEILVEEFGFVDNAQPLAVSQPQPQPQPQQTGYAVPQQGFAQATQQMMQAQYPSQPANDDEELPF